MSNQMYESFLYEAGDLGIPSPLTCNWKEDPIDYGLLDTTKTDTEELEVACESGDNSEDETKEMLTTDSPRPRIRVDVHGGILRHDFT
jgi:hypothetical protein